MRVYESVGSPEKPNYHIIHKFDQNNNAYVEMEQKDWEQNKSTIQ